MADIIDEDWKNVIRACVGRRWDDAAREELERMREEASRVSTDAVDAFDVWTCTFAAAEDNVECLKYLDALGCRWSLGACEAAAANGQLECLKYLNEHGYEWDEWTCQAAAANGHLECLTYAHEHGCHWNEDTCAGAARHGHLECLKYAHEHGCPWDWWTFDSAADCGRVVCLRYAREHGCPWDVKRCKFAAEDGRWECLRCAREVGADGVDEFADILDDYVQVWVHFIVHIALDRRETTPELSARRFHELYKEFDAHRSTLKARLRERANEISWKR